MDTPALAPTSPRRAEPISEIDGGSIFFQPNRLDVLVHLLALEQLAGVDGPAVEPVIDWVDRSDAFAAIDHEPTMSSYAAELLTSPTPELAVTFASGGQLVRGAGAAAASLYSGTPATRIDGSDKVVDRSIAGLTEAGWTTSQCQSLLHAWALRDAASTVVLIDLDSPAADDAEHELRCRFTSIHTELDHLSLLDAEVLGASASGSTRLMCLRSDHRGISAVAERHGGAIVFVAHRREAAIALASLWADDRATSSSAAHDQRLRRMRRQALTAQLLERTLGR